MNSAFSGISGKISGRVIDKITGEALSGANVTIEEMKIGASTDLDGYYYLINIPPGYHDVTASFLGYRTMLVTDVFVMVDNTSNVDFQMESTTLQAAEEVVIEAQRPEIETDITSTKVNISSVEIADLPVNTVSDILRLQAGVVDDGGLHVRGGRTGELAFIVDGHRLEDPLFGGSGTSINTSAIEQMELVTGTFNAEYGNAMSGIVNIVTKEKVENYHGNIAVKTSALGIEETSDNLGEIYSEGFLSGPVPGISSAGFLLSGKWVDSDNYYQSGKLVTIDGTTYTTGEKSGKPFGYDNLGSFFGKLYYNLTNNSKVSVTYNYDDREWQNYVHSYKYIPDSAYVRYSDSQLLALNFTHSPSQKLFYEIKLSTYEYNYLKNYGGHNWTEYSDTSVYYDSWENGVIYQSEFNGYSGNEEYINQKIRTNAGRVDATYQYNKFHQFKAGAEVKLHDIDYFYIYAPERLYQGGAYLNDYRKYPYEGALYLQDKIEFKSLVVNAGLRYDFYHPNTDYIADPNTPDAPLTEAEPKHQLSPRLGIAYPVTRNTVFHFSYGHFFQRPTFEVMYEDFSRNLNVNWPLIGDPDLEPESTQSYELGLNTKLSDKIQAQITVFSKKISGLIGVNWVIKEAYELNRYSYYTNEDFAYVKGFEVNMKYRSRQLIGGLNYTFSIAEGSSSSQQERYSGSYVDAGIRSLQFFPLDFDQRHMVDANIGLKFGKDDGPFGYARKVFQNSYLSIIFEYGSGLAFTYNPSRERDYQPDLNNARMPATYTFDLEAEKKFYIDKFSFGVFCEVYNLFNRKNVRYVYSYTGEPDYSGEEESEDYENVPTYYYPPRTIFMGINFGF